MKVVVAMDSFKGSLTSLEAGEAVRRGILRTCPDAEVDVFPLADGGEGSLACIAPYVGGAEITLTVTGPLGAPVDASYIYNPATHTAYIEMARASGLTLLDPAELDAMHATSFGTGELMLDAVRRGALEMYIFVGGSATSDGGAGMLQALGAKLLNENGSDIGPGAAGLADLCTADLSQMAGRDLSIVVASDVTNPLCGHDGAGFVYGPQKGASEADCAKIDEYLYKFSGVLGFDPHEDGTGAAGGITFALKNVLGAKIVPGASLVMSLTGIAQEISLCNIVITGEGRMDSQTVKGKAPMRVLDLARTYGKPVTGICGMLGDGSDECLKAGFEQIVPLVRPTMVREDAMLSLEETAELLVQSIGQ